MTAEKWRYVAVVLGLVLGVNILSEHYIMELVPAAYMIFAGAILATFVPRSNKE